MSFLYYMRRGVYARVLALISKTYGTLLQKKLQLVVVPYIQWKQSSNKKMAILGEINTGPSHHTRMNGSMTYQSCKREKLSYLSPVQYKTASFGTNSLYALNSNGVHPRFREEKRCRF